MCSYLDADLGRHDNVPQLAAHFQHTKREIVSQKYFVSFASWTEESFKKFYVVSFLFMLHPKSKWKFS